MNYIKNSNFEAITVFKWLSLVTWNNIITYKKKQTLALNNLTRVDMPKNQPINQKKKPWNISNKFAYYYYYY